jgi:hypothetical protein
MWTKQLFYDAIAKLYYATKNTISYGLMSLKDILLTLDYSIILVFGIS